MSLLLVQSSLAWPLILVAFVGGYLSGSVPYGLILGKMAGLGDVRQSGSGNFGATNILRVGGKKLAAFTLLLDMLKGLVPVLVAKQIHMDYAILAALGAFLGHLFPVWLRFKGGKGVATAWGVMTALHAPLGLALVCVWILTALISKYSSLSALMTCCAAPFLAVFLTNGNFQIGAATFLIALVVAARHHANIRRLINGTEGKINLGSKQNA